MLNMIKMDVYRMFHTKSLYVIWIILLASSLFTSFLAKIDYDAVNKEWEEQQEQAVQTDVSKEENVQAGLELRRLQDRKIWQLIKNNLAIWSVQKNYLRRKKMVISGRRKTIISTWE